MDVGIVDSYLIETTSAVNHKLEQLVPIQRFPHKLIYEAARYALLAPGKRIRPVLLLATSELFDVKQKSAITAACAFEMIHAYSLIHDDLPCMDNDDFRRGRPTLHRFYSEAIALLAGDFLLTHAFYCISHDEEINANQKIALIQLISQSAGGDGMIGGQLLDISVHKPDLLMLENLHSRKTGALIQAAIVGGAILGNVNQEQINSLAQLGKKLGLAFQIIDDILDVTASVEKHGRIVSTDAINAKTTYVTLLGLDQAKVAAKEAIEHCYAILDELPNKSFHLRSIVKKIASQFNS